MEIWDLYDEERRLTGDTMRRGDPIPAGRYHLVVHCAVFNEAGQMLIQHRQPFKEGWSNLWDITMGGSAVAGDDSRSACAREVAEELGLALDLDGVRPAMTLYFPGIIDDVYVVRRELDPTRLRCQPEEVSEARWATEQEILEMIRTGAFIPYAPGFISFLFQWDRRPGTAHTRRDWTTQKQE